MYACACDYAHLCHAVGLHLCMHEHVIMHIYVLHSAIPRTPQESLDHLFGLFNRLFPHGKNIWFWVIYLVSLLDNSVNKRLSSLKPSFWSLTKYCSPKRNYLVYGPAICPIYYAFPKSKHILLWGFVLAKPRTPWEFLDNPFGVTYWWLSPKRNV